MPRRSKYAAGAAASGDVWERMSLNAFSRLLLALYFTPATLSKRKAVEGESMFEYQHGLLVERVWNKVVAHRAAPQRQPEPDDAQAASRILDNPLAPKLTFRDAAERRAFLDGVDRIRSALR